MSPLIAWTTPGARGSLVLTMPQRPHMRASPAPASRGRRTVTPVAVAKVGRRPGYAAAVALADHGPAALAGARVLVLGCRWPADPFVARLLDRLHRDGAELTVAGPDPVPAPHRWLPLASGRRVPLPSLLAACGTTVAAALRRPPRLARARQLVDLARRADRFRPLERVPFARDGWDVTYVPWTLAAVDHLPVLDLLPPVVVSCRGSQVSVAPWNPDRVGVREGLGAVFERAVAVHAVSEAMVEDAVGLGLDRSKARVVRPGADTSVFVPPPGRPEGGRAGEAGRLRIVAVGALGWVKGFEFLVVAVGRLVAAGVDVSVEVVGEGRDRGRLVAAARDGGVGERVRLVGRLSPVEVRERLWGADVLVLPSVSEGISNAVLEAMATGLAVVTTDCGGMVEVVSDGVEGLVVPVRDVGALVEALGRLAADPGLRDRMGRAGLVRVRAGLTADDNAAGIAGLLAARRRPPARRVSGPARTAASAPSGQAVLPAGLHVAVAGLVWPPEPFLDRLFRRLLAADARLTVLTARRVEPPYRGEVVPGTHARRLDLVRAIPRRAASAARHPRLAAEIWRRTGCWSGRLRAQRFQQHLALALTGADVVYFPWNEPASAFVPVLDLLPPVVVSCRGAQVSVAPWNPDRVGVREGLGAVFERAVAVHAVSEAMVEDAVGLGLDRSKARVVRPGADTSVFVPPPGRPEGGRAGEPGRLRIVATGSLIWRKGFEFLVVAVGRLVAAGVDVSVEVVGEGRDRGRLVAAARDGGVGERVRLVGRLSPVEVRERLWGADVLVLPSVSEGISNAVLEAMATGLAVVTTDCGGMVEVVSDGVEGLVVPVRDVGALVEALGRLAADPGLRDRMGRAGLVRVRAGLTADDNAAGIAGLLAAAADHRPAA